MKKKDKKNLLIALVVLAAVIFTGLGIWNYSADGDFLRFNQRSNLPTVAPIEEAPPEMVPVELPDAIDIDSTSMQDGGMNGVTDGGMNGIK